MFAMGFGINEKTMPDDPAIECTANLNSMKRFVVVSASLFR